MSNVVFILGAGSSQKCGAPLMADFLDVASYLHITGKVTKKATHFEKVFKAIGALQAVHSKSQLDLNNIESIFTTFEIANTIGKLPGIPEDEIPGLISSLKEVIVTTLESTIRFPVIESTVGVPPPYDSFTDLLHYITIEATPNRTGSVITFNYDIAIDVALHNARLRMDYCLGDNISSDSIPLLKLHGSLNWALRSDDLHVIPLTLRDYLQKYRPSRFQDIQYCHIPIGTQLQEYFSKYTDTKVDAEPVLVPPTWNKAEHHHILSQVWGRAAKELGEAEYIFIIGYSLSETDAFFRLLYALVQLGICLLRKLRSLIPTTLKKPEKDLNLLWA